MTPFFDVCVTFVAAVMVSGIWSPKAPNAKLGLYGATANAMATGSIVWLVARQWATYSTSLGVVP